MKPTDRTKMARTLNSDLFDINRTGEYAKAPAEQARRAKIRAQIEQRREDAELKAACGEVWDE